MGQVSLSSFTGSWLACSLAPAGNVGTRLRLDTCGAKVSVMSTQSSFEGVGLVKSMVRGTFLACLQGIKVGLSGNWARPVPLTRNLLKVGGVEKAVGPSRNSKGSSEAGVPSNDKFRCRVARPQDRACANERGEES